MAHTTVEIDVTPEAVKGRDVCCRIEPTTRDDEQYVTDDGKIILPSDRGPYELNFHLRDGKAADLTYDEGGPWSCREGGCPEVDDQDERQFPTQAQRIDREGKLLKVRATPAGKNSRYYSLNFTGGVRCDPVIIHD